MTTAGHHPPVVPKPNEFINEDHDISWPGENFKILKHLKTGNGQYKPLEELELDCIFHS
jgi:hypothetical protein